MFAKLTVVLSTLAVLASAIPTPAVSQCNTGPAQCCNTLQSTKDLDVATLHGLLGVAVQGVSAFVGLGCTPISVVAITEGTNCAQQPVCCQNNQFGGLINLGCDPVSL